MDLVITIEQEHDGRWIAEVEPLTGVLAYGATRVEAVIRVKALAMRTVADKLEHGDVASHLDQLSFREIP